MNFSLSANMAGFCSDSHIWSSRGSHDSQSFKSIAKVNTKLRRQNLICKQLHCVFACYLVSMLLFKCVDDLLFLHYFIYSQGIASAIKVPKIILA